MSKKIIITCGDADGIGPEVTGKAFGKLSSHLDQHKFLVFVGRNADLSFFPSYSEVSSPAEALRPGVNILLRDDNPVHWVDEASDLCLQSFDALVTGPLSKETSERSSLSVLGHTDLFRKKFPESKIYMSFIGRDFSIVLLSDHLPLKSVCMPEVIEKLPECLDVTLSAKAQFGLHKPVAVLGINPHAGENGLLGEEEFYISKSIKNYAEKGIVGPLVPDAAFLKENWGKYSFYVCMYHDQGLIPFKMVHGQDAGFQISLGLPFLRTSVDHGTAKSLVGKGVANPHSMVEAIEFCLK